MGRYRKIDVRIWNDKKFRALDDKAKLAFILLLTHPDMNQLGFIRARSVSLSFELGWHPDVMSNAIRMLCQMGMLMVDESAGLMFLPNFLKYNSPNGVNGAKSWAGILDLLPECDLLKQGLVRIKPFIDGLSEGVKDGLPEDIKNAIEDAIQDGITTASRIQEQEQEQEQDKEEANASRRFLEKPTLGLAPTSQPKKAPGIPFQRIVDIYNAKLGERLGVCRQLNSKRESWLRARYHDVSIAIESTDQAEVLDGFGQYYDKIARSDFLMGRKTDFRASFDWIHQSSNYLKIYEGNYENGRR